MPARSTGQYFRRSVSEQALKVKGAAQAAPFTSDLVSTVSASDLDVREDVRLADAGFLDRAVPAVGPYPVDNLVTGGKTAIVADERPGLEEAEIRIPRLGAD